MKKFTIPVLIIMLALATPAAGCRSRITASSDADEILDAEDALGTSEKKEGVAQWNGSFTETKEEQEETTEAQTTTSEAEITQENTESVPEVTTVSSESDDNEKREDTPPQYSNERRPGRDQTNTNPGRSSANSGQSGSGNGNGNGSGTGNGDPTVPPTTEPIEPVEPTVKPEEPESSESESGKEVKVSFDAGEGNLDSDTLEITVEYGKEYPALPSASRGGFTFAGWYTQSGGKGTRIDEGSIVSIEEDHTLYAFWAQREIHIVRFHTEGVKGNYWLGKQDSSYDRQVYVGETYGDEFPVPRFRAGYSFVGWFTDPEGGEPVTNTQVFNAGGDVDLYVHFNYDPLAYWTGILNNVNGYPCQGRAMICEYDKNNVPVKGSVFISRLGNGAEQAAGGMPDGITTEELIYERPNAAVFIKMIGNMSNAQAVADEVQSRFPTTFPYNRVIYVIPREAENGSAEVTLLYNLAIKMKIWPEAFEQSNLNPHGLDALDKAMEELGIGQINIVERGK